jgi:type IV secretory pathway VirB3-like protein
MLSSQSEKIHGVPIHIFTYVYMATYSLGPNMLLLLPVVVVVVVVVVAVLVASSPFLRVVVVVVFDDGAERNPPFNMASNLSIA